MLGVLFGISVLLLFILFPLIIYAVIDVHNAAHPQHVQHEQVLTQKSTERIITINNNNILFLLELGNKQSDYLIKLVESYLKLKHSDSNSPNHMIEYNMTRRFIRNEFARYLRDFYTLHSPRTELSNDNVCLRLIHSNDSVSLFCINKKKQNFYILHNSNRNIINNLLTFWGFIDMVFNEKTTMDDIRQLDDMLDMNSIVRQNKSRLKQINANWYIFKICNPYSEPYIICKKRKKKNNYFIIKGNLATLLEIYILVFSQYRNKKYDELLEQLSCRKDCTIEQFPSRTEKKENKNKKNYSNQSNLININSAALSEISKLPGINIILAKRIVLRRDEINGFKTKEEFYEFCKLKPHFIEQIDTLITAGKFDIQEVILIEGERTIDIIDDYYDIDDSYIENNNSIIVDTIDNYDDDYDDDESDSDNDDDDNGIVIDL